MKKNILYVILILLFSISIVAIFQVLNQPEHNNGFDRNMKISKWSLGKTLRLPSKSFIFINIKDHILTLQDASNPLALFATNYSLSSFNKINLKLPLILNKKRMNVGMLDSDLYLTNGSRSTLNIVSLKGKNDRGIKLPSVGYDQINPISKGSLVARDLTIQNNSLKRRITKVTLKTPVIIKSFDLDKQLDEFFSNDGLLKYSPIPSRFLYSYFYRGEFLCLDTNLNLLYTAKTIDTVRFAKIKLAKATKRVKDKVLNRVTQANPPYIVNRNYTLYNNLIFIMSGLKANNEKLSDFKNNQIVDVYSIHNGKYLYSFYIPKYKRYKLRDFKIINNSIIGIYENFLVTYILKDQLWL